MILCRPIVFLPLFDTGRIMPVFIGMVPVQEKKGHSVIAKKQFFPSCVVIRKLFFECWRKQGWHALKSSLRIIFHSD